MHTERIRRMVAALLNQPVYRVTDGQQLGNLIADGTSIEQVLLQCQELLGVRFVAADMKELICVRDLIRLLRSESGGAIEVDFSEPSFQAMYEFAYGHCLPVQDAVQRL
jgi:hypothetical protein